MLISDALALDAHFITSGGQSRGLVLTSVEVLIDAINHQRLVLTWLAPRITSRFLFSGPVRSRATHLAHQLLLRQQHEHDNEKLFEAVHNRLEDREDQVRRNVLHCLATQLHHSMPTQVDVQRLCACLLAALDSSQAKTRLAALEVVVVLPQHDAECLTSSLILEKVVKLIM